MSPELEAFLYQKYPILYRDAHTGEEGASLLHLGIQCGDGWFNLLNSLSSEIEEIIEQLLLIGSKEELLPRAFFVSSEFGRLRFRLGAATNKRILRAIERAEQKSTTICEICGDVGNPQRSDDGSIFTRCHQCLY